VDVLNTCKWLPVIDPERCTGCRKCVEVCGPGSLKIVCGIAALVCAETCGSEEHCIPVCPERAIRMEWVLFRGNADVGQWSNSDLIGPLNNCRSHELSSD